MFVQGFLPDFLKLWAKASAPARGSAEAFEVISRN